MTDPVKKDDIEKLAHRMAWRYRKSSDTQHSDTYTFNAATLHEFVKTVVSAEREACAAVAEDTAAGVDAESIAEAIRARSNVEAKAQTRQRLSPLATS